MHAKDGTTTCDHYCTTYLISNGKSVTLIMTYVPNDESEAGSIDHIEAYPFEIDLLLANVCFYN